MSDADRTLLLALPLPLAQAWRRTLYAETPTETHERALYTLEAALKFAASAAAVTWAAQPSSDDPARKACEALVRPSLGQWEAILRSCLAALPETDPVTRWLARMLAQKVDVEVPGLEGRSVGRVLADLPVYRNAVVHGAGLSQQEAAQRAPALAALCREVLHATVEDGAPTLFGAAGSTVVRLTGVGAMVAHGSAQRPRGSAWLEFSGRSLSLSPLWIFDPDEDDVLVLNKGAGLPKVEYLSYGVPRGGTGLSVWRGPVAEEAARFLKTATGRADLETSHVLALVEETEVRALADQASSEWIGPYRVIRRVARGGQGVLYEAIQENPPRRVALKVLLQHAAADESARRRFREEAATLARVEHPGVVPVYAAGEHEGVPWIAMRFVEGRNLAEVIEALPDRADRTTLRDWETAARIETDARQTQPTPTHADRMAMIGRDLGRALAACHEQGVVHRDVKPANAMVDADGRVLLTDFGLARTAEARSRTQTRRMVGTLHYLAPESLLPAKKNAPDARMDVYGLGATLYELLTHRRPFADHEGDDAALMLAVQVKDPPPLRRIVPATPRDLEVIVSTAMEKDPERRYPSAAALADDLDRFLCREPIRARPAGRLLRLRRWSARRPALAVLILALAVGIPLLAMVGGYLYASWDNIKRGEQAQFESSVEQSLERAFLQYFERNTLRAQEAFQAVLDLKPDSAEAMAGLALVQDDWKETLRLLEARPELLEQHPDLRRLVALALDKLGREEEAAKVAAEVPPLDSSLGYFLAALEASRAQPSERSYQRRAMTYLTRAIQTSARPRAIYYYFRTRIAGVVGDRTAVREMAEIMRIRWRGSYQAWLSAGYGLTHVGDFVAGIEACETATRLNPRSAVAFTELGDALTRQALYGSDRRTMMATPPEPRMDLIDRAITAYRAALAIRADLPATHCNLGRALFVTRDTDAAIASFREAIRQQERLPRAHFNLGRTLMATGKAEEAIASYRKAILYNPNDIDAYLNLGTALVATGQPDEAEATFRKAVSLRAHPQLLAIGHYNLGLLLAESGELRDAVTSFRNAVKRWSRVPKGQESLIAALLELGRIDEALQAYRDAGTPKMSQAGDACRIGWAALQHEELALAEKALTDAVALEPDNPYGKAYLAVTRMKLGCYVDALPLVQRTVEETRPGFPARSYIRYLGRCRALAAMEPKLAEVWKDAYEPEDAREAYWLAYIATKKRWMLTAANLYRTALEAAGQLPRIDDRSARAWAARAASAGAAGRGRNRDEELGATERAAWRKRALVWLRTELDYQRQQHASGRLPKPRLQTIARDWLAARDLAYVRDAEHLKGWSFADRAECSRLWADVAKAAEE